MPMPSGDEIQASLAASWRLMQGRADAVRQLDVSADGFWNSFFAIVVSLPPLFAVWTSEAIDIAPAPGALGDRLGIVLRLGIIEIVIWVASVLPLAYVIYRMGRHDRVAPFVVSNNWASALLNWAILPFILLVSLVPSLADVGTVLLLAAVIATLVFAWRLNNAVLDMGLIVPTVMIVAMVGIALAVDYALRNLLGLPFTQSG